MEDSQKTAKVINDLEGKLSLAEQEKLKLREVALKHSVKHVVTLQQLKACLNQLGS